MFQHRPGRKKLPLLAKEYPLYFLQARFPPESQYYLSPDNIIKCKWNKGVSPMIYKHIPQRL